MARRRDKGQEKAIARRRVAVLLERARAESGGPDADLADRYVELARRVSTRFQLPWRSGRTQACSSCGAFRGPATSRTRIHAGRVVMTCLRCGHVRRRPLPSSPADGTEDA